MTAMIILSLSLNVAVLVPVCIGLFKNADWTLSAYGSASPAQGILLSVYFSICVMSAVLLFIPNRSAVGALLMVQIVYKITTPITVGSAKNPVVISNLVIAAVHLATILLIGLYELENA